MLAAIVLAIATAKALSVMMYFMHLKFERAWKYLLLAPTFILAAGMMVALVPDIGRHYYTVDSPQIHEYEQDQLERAEVVEGHH
jgi:cytochrome c oxidase subunit 4